MKNRTIALAGATGNLGGRVAGALLERGAQVVAIVRPGTAPDRVATLREKGAAIIEADFGDAGQMARALDGVSCVVSTLSGVRDTIVDAQSVLLAAAVDAGVPRFIPSDYCIDYTTLPPGRNRNLELRREFGKRLDEAPIAATSVLNGAFAELLAGQAPIVLTGVRRVLYWEDADQLLDFTTIDDTAAFTAAAALDQSTPRYLRVAGDQISARGLAHLASELTGARFPLLRGGGLGRLAMLIAVARVVSPGRSEPFPPWQGMQYLHDMFGGRAKLAPLDNDRYPGISWTTSRDVLAGHLLS